MKERLIGAAVLVAIAVLVVPWVLDGDGERGSDPVPSLALPVPEQPLPVQRQTLNLDADTAPQPPVRAERAAAPAAADGAAEPQQTAQGAGRDESSSPVAAAPPEERQAAAPTRQTAPPSSSSPPPPRRDAPATQPSAARGARGASVAAAAGDWQVQLGSFGEEENARRLVQRVSTFGYQAAVSTVRSNGRTMYRVRVGPQATREEASAVASSLSAHGFVAQVVTAD